MNFLEKYLQAIAAIRASGAAVKKHRIMARRIAAIGALSPVLDANYQAVKSSAAPFQPSNQGFPIQ